MIYFYGRVHKHEFPKRDSILRTLNNGDVAVITDKDTEYQYIFTNQMGYWTQVSEGYISNMIVHKDCFDDCSPRDRIRMCANIERKYQEYERLSKIFN